MAEKQLEEMLKNMDDSKLTETDAFDVVDELYDVAVRWNSIGAALHLNRLNVIEDNNRGRADECLKEVVSEFLSMNYDFGNFGVPTWKMIVKAVAHRSGGANMNLALKIAGKHSTVKPSPDSSVAAADETKTTPSAPSDKILNERPDLKLVINIEYLKDSKKTNFRLLDETSHLWKMVAKFLGINHAKCYNFERGNPGDLVAQADAMLTSWASSDIEATWAKLIKALRDANQELQVAASEFEYALIHKI